MLFSDGGLKRQSDFKAKTACKYSCLKSYITVKAMCHKFPSSIPELGTELSTQ